MNESDVIRLRHMLDAAREALSFVAGRNSEDLGRDRMLVLALVKEIEIIGEAASRISDESRKALPRIPWPKIIAMRNRLIHAYADVDLSIVWDTLTGALPELLRELETALAD
jgi:uncharacterized protein with HEPN domain